MKLRDGVLEVTCHGKSNPCPHCGSRSVAEMFFGEPDMSEDLSRRERSGEIILAGCVVFPVRWYCNACGRAWGERAEPGR